MSELEFNNLGDGHFDAWFNKEGGYWIMTTPNHDCTYISKEQMKEFAKWLINHV